MGRTPKSIAEIYEDYMRRRDALINALTDDADEFANACDPNRENLCLYGNPDGSWNVDLPAAEVPPELPEPVLGINFARDGMDRKDWLALCAVHSDAWLMSVLFFYAARFDDNGRSELFSLVNQHPTVYEATTGRLPRNSLKKRRQSVGGRTPAYGGIPAVKAEFPPPSFFKGPVSADHPAPTGRLMVEQDLNTQLPGRQAELFWPDDGKWYLVAIMDVRMGKAKVLYATGEEETIDLLEVIREKQLNLL